MCPRVLMVSPNYVDLFREQDEAITAERYLADNSTFD